MPYKPDQARLLEMLMLASDLRLHSCGAAYLTKGLTTQHAARQHHISAVSHEMQACSHASCSLLSSQHHCGFLLAQVCV